jgi:hypothetical protein
MLLWQASVKAIACGFRSTVAIAAGYRETLSETDVLKPEVHASTMQQYSSDIVVSVI